MASLAKPDSVGRIIPFPDDADRRLRRALRSLDVALAEQRAAIAAFRGEIQALSAAVDGLGGSARALQDSLAQAASDTALAHSASLELAATAEMMERLARR